jgi:hypothetical protein
MAFLITAVVVPGYVIDVDLTFPRAELYLQFPAIAV